MLPVLFNPPDFHSKRPSSGGKRGTFPPSDLDAMGRWAATRAPLRAERHALANHPNPLPFTAYQIWNEPALQLLAAEAEAREYLELLKTVSAAIKAVDPNAEIVTAGLPDSRQKGAIRLDTFLKAMYKAGGSARSTPSRSTPTRSTRATWAS